MSREKHIQYEVVDYTKDEFEGEETTFSLDEFTEAFTFYKSLENAALNITSYYLDDDNLKCEFYGYLLDTDKDEKLITVNKEFTSSYEPIKTLQQVKSKVDKLANELEEKSLKLTNDYEFKLIGETLEELWDLQEDLRKGQWIEI